MNFLFSISEQFTDTVIDVAPLGNGLINDTFLVTTGSAPFVLQRINRGVFPYPEQIMANLITLNQHMRKKDTGPVELKIPEIIKTHSGETHVRDQQGDFWRALSFIDNSESLETIRTRTDAEEAGRALGGFHRLLSDLDSALLNDTLPGFHITPDYLSRYHRIASRSGVLRPTQESRYCTDFIESHEFMANDLERAKGEGLLKIRVIHGDPKLNNFLFDKCSKKAIGLIDLDTVKPGLLHYDIGDCLRSCCLIPETGEFDPEIAAAILAGYLTEAAQFFTEPDYDYLYPAIRLIPFELGLRFYTDFLEGDRYFKVSEPGQNLHRAAEQFGLCESIIKQEHKIKNIIDDFRRKAPG
jgi:Ser/Thr protein kinase RdoA (MazF antagonist)